MDPREQAFWSNPQSWFVAMPQPCAGLTFINHVASHKPVNYKSGRVPDPRGDEPLWKIQANITLFLVLTTLNILLLFKDIMSFIYKIISSELIASYL